MVWEHACTLEVPEVPSHAEMVRDLFIALRAVKDIENHVVRGEIWGSNGISIIGPCFLFVCLLFFFRHWNIFMQCCKNWCEWLGRSRVMMQKTGAKRQTSSSRCFAHRTKTNNIIAVFFFSYFHSIMRFKEKPSPESWIPR